MSSTAEVGDLVNEADIVVFAGRHARDDLAPGHFRIDDGLAPAPSIIDHHDEILHALVAALPVRALPELVAVFLKIRNRSSNNF